MTRLIGAALLVGGCAGAGLRCRRAMREKVRVLADLIAALGRIRSELVTNRTPLGELTAQLAAAGIRIKSISSYYHLPEEKDTHLFVVNYSVLDEDALARALEGLPEHL